LRNIILLFANIFVYSLRNLSYTDIVSRKTDRYIVEFRKNSPFTQSNPCGGAARVQSLTLLFSQSNSSYVFITHEIVGAVTLFI
jgi:hypothetical protein